MCLLVAVSKLLANMTKQLSYYFPDKTMWQSFVCAMTAAVTLQAFDPFRSGKLVMYQVTYSTGWHGFEMVPFALLGVFGVSYPPDIEIFADFPKGRIRRNVHQTEHESCTVEKGSNLAPGADRSSCD